MFNLFKRRKLPELVPPPKYRLVPDEKGTYTLEKWHADVSMYIVEEVQIIDEKHADRVIANLERDIIYYREESK